MMAEGFLAGSSYVDLGVDLGGLTRGFAEGQRATRAFTDDVEQRVAKTSGSFSKMGSLVSGIFTGIGFKAAEIGFDLVGQGASAAFGLISGGMDDARGAGLLLAQTENVIKGMGNVAGRSADQVNDLASSLSDAEGKSLFGDDMIVESTNLLLTFGELKGSVLDTATALSVDMAQSLGGEPKSQAVALGKALNDPIRGVTALTRVGVSFTEQQKEQIKVLQESGDMVGAQNIILGELQKQFGGSAAAAAAAASPMVRFRGVLGEAAETVGGSLLPLLDQFTGWFASPAVMTGIESFATSLAAGIGTAATTIGSGVTTIIGIVGHVRAAFGDGGITAAIDTLLFDIGKVIPAVEPVTSFLRDILPQAVSFVTTAFTLARDGITTFIAAYNGDWQNSDRVLLIHQAFGVLGQVLGTVVVPAIQSVVSWMTQNWDLVTKVGVAVGVAVAVFQTLSGVVAVVGSVTAAIGGMGTAIGAAGGIIGTIVAILGGPLTIALGAIAIAAGLLALAWQTNFGGIQEKTQAVVNWWTGTAWPALVAGFTTVVEHVGLLRDAWDRDFESVRGFITTLQTSWDTAVAAVGIAIDLAKGYISGFRDTVETKIAEAVAFFIELPGKITSAIAGFPSLLIQAGKDLINGLIDGIKSIDVGSVLSSVVNAGIAAAKAAVGIKSPSTKTRDEIGKPMGEGIVVGLESTGDSIKQMMGRIVEGAVIPAAQSAAGAITQLLDTGDFRGGIFGLNEDDPFIDFLFRVRDDAKATAAVLKLLTTGDFRGGILGLDEDDPFITRLLDAARAGGEGIADSLRDDTAALRNYIQAVLEDGDYLNDWLTHLDGPTAEAAKSLGMLMDAGGETADALRRYFSAIMQDGDYLNDWLTHLPAEMRDKVLAIGKQVAGAAGQAGGAIADEIVGGFDDKKPMEAIANKIKTMLGQTIPADAIPYAGALGELLGAAIGEGATKKLKTVLGQGIPGAVADVSKSLMSDKNRSDEAKPGKMGNLGQFVQPGEGWLGAIVDDAAATADSAALTFAETFGQALQLTKPVAIERLETYFHELRRDAIAPALSAGEAQMSLSAQAGIAAYGSSLIAGLGVIDGAVSSINASLASIERDVTVNIHANVDEYLQVHSPSIVEQTLMNIRDLAGAIPRVDLSMARWSVPAPPAISRPAMPAFAESGSAGGRGELHIHLGPIDLSGTNLSLDQVDGRIRSAVQSVVGDSEVLSIVRQRGGRF